MKQTIDKGSGNSLTVKQCPCIDHIDATLFKWFSATSIVLKEKSCQSHRPNSLSELAKQMFSEDFRFKQTLSTSNLKFKKTTLQPYWSLIKFYSFVGLLVCWLRGLLVVYSNAVKKSCLLFVECGIYAAVWKFYWTPNGIVHESLHLNKNNITSWHQNSRRHQTHMILPRHFDVFLYFFSLAPWIIAFKAHSCT